VVRQTRTREPTFAPKHQWEQPAKKNARAIGGTADKSQMQPQLVFVWIAPLFQRREREVIHPKANIGGKRAYFALDALVHIAAKPNLRNRQGQSLESA
jgi:hypothetical protein